MQILENVLKYIYISMKCAWTESDLRCRYGELVKTMLKMPMPA